jgi:small-conductance mechanosensitive channel
MEIYLGNRYFPKPSKEAWAIAHETANILQGPFTDITAEQRLKTVRATTRARTASAAKELQLHKDIFRATRTVHDIIEQAKTQNITEQRAIAALTKFRREYFSKTRNMINQELRNRLHTGRHTRKPPTGRASNKLSLKFKLKLDYFYKLRAKLKLPKLVFI